MSGEESVVEERGPRGAALRTIILAIAVGSLALGIWATGQPEAAAPQPVPAAPVTPAPAPEQDPATSVLQVRPIDGTPFTVLFSGIGPDDVEDGPSLFTAPRVEGVHNVVLLDTNTGASRRLLPTDERLVLNARLLGRPGDGAPPEWVALDVAGEEGGPVDLVVVRLDGAVPALVLPNLSRVVRVWARADGSLGALVRQGDTVAYRLIDGEALAITAASTVPLGGGTPEPAS